jgi:hypothetical protein
MKFSKFIRDFIIGLTLIVVGSALFSWHVVREFDIDDDYPIFSEVETMTFEFEELDRLYISGANFNVYIHEDDKYEDNIIVEIEGTDINKLVNIKNNTRTEELYISQDFASGFNTTKRLLQDIEKSIEEKVIYNYGYLYNYDVHIYVDDEDTIRDLDVYRTYIRRNK